MSVTDSFIVITGSESKGESERERQRAGLVSGPGSALSGDTGTQYATGVW